MKNIQSFGNSLPRTALKNIKGGAATQAAAYCRGTCLPGACPQTDGPYTCVCDFGNGIPFPPGRCIIYTRE